MNNWVYKIKIIFSTYLIKIGIFYDNSNHYMEDMISYVIETNNKFYKNNESFTFNYSMNEVMSKNSTNKLYKKCKYKYN